MNFPKFSKQLFTSKILIDSSHTLLKFEILPNSILLQSFLLNNMKMNYLLKINLNNNANTIFLFFFHYIYTVIYLISKLNLVKLVFLLELSITYPIYNQHKIKN
jgi:hypothetical protein